MDETDDVHWFATADLDGLNMHRTMQYVAHHGRLNQTEARRLRQAVAAWRSNRGSRTDRAAVHALVLDLTAAGVRRQEIAAVAGVATATVGSWKVELAHRAAPREVHREASAEDVVRLRALLAAVPYDGRRCSWAGDAGREFITAARAVVAAGVPARRLAEAMVGVHPIGPDTIVKQVTRHDRTSGQSGWRVRPVGRRRRTPDSARLPRASRPVTPDEWAHLLALHAAIEVRGNYSAYTDTERHRIAVPLVARDVEILRLWVDRVSDAHIADLLGLSDEAIVRARRHARRTTGANPVRRPHAPPLITSTEPTLGAAERHLLCAALDRVRDDGGQQTRSPHLDTLMHLIGHYRSDGISVAEIAEALQIDRAAYNGLLRSYRLRTRRTT
jgi:DNA-binding CsgD family transcriptional regulator